MNKIAVLVLNNLVNDSRVLKEIESLSKYFIRDYHHQHLKCGVQNIVHGYL